MSKLFLLLILIVSTALSAHCQIIYVPDDFSTIQEAIDYASDYDTILVEQGNYTENLVINKPITLSSNYIFSNDITDVENTIVDGNDYGSVVMVSNIIVDTAFITGLTIKNGSGTLTDPLGYGLEFFHGGGFYIEDVHAIVLHHLIIRENQILSDHNSAGGIFCHNSYLMLSDSKVQDNLVRGSSFLGEGAGIYLLDSEAEIRNCEISGNSSSVAYGQGGGVFMKNADVEIINTEILENECIDAGAIQIYDSDLLIMDCSIINNQAHITGAIQVNNFNGGSVSFVNSIFNDNVASLTNGTINFYHADAEILNCEINNNVGGYSSGGISASLSEINIYNSEISGNESSSGIGGDGAGIKAYNCNLYLNNVLFDGNFCAPANSYNQGGAIHVSQSDLLMDSVIVSNNVAAEGGGMYVMMSNVRMQQSLISGHNALEGGAIYSYGSEIEIISSTISENFATTGGGIHSQSNHLYFVNSILWNNEPAEMHFRYQSPGDSTYVDFAYSDIRGFESHFTNPSVAGINWHAGNLDEDPLFEDAINGDFELSGSSPLIDAGTVYFELDENVLVDYSSEDYSGSAPDMGAHEYESGTVSTLDREEKNVIIRPNPFKDNIFITSSGENVSYTLSNVSGEIVRQGITHPGSEFRIKAADLTAGIYFLRIFYANRTISKKVVKLSSGG